jgi:hypothetical protein
MKLVDIAARFGLSHIGAVSFMTHCVRKKKQDDPKFNRMIGRFVKSIISKVTCPLFCKDY